MKSKTTLLWFVLAAALAVVIWFYEQHFQPVAPVTAPLLPGLRADQVTAIQIFPADAGEISVRRTNNVWLLEKPIRYPARADGIKSLLATLEKLTPTLRLTASDLQGKNTDVEYGFDNPAFSVVIQSGDQQWQFRVGNKTAPGDGVFVRSVGRDGLFLTGTEWLPQLPRTAEGWRDTALVGLTDTFDWIVITNGTKTIELRQDPTNQLWRMTRPLAARANAERITEALQQLRTAQVEQFLAGSLPADLTAYGLQPDELTVWLGRGTNLLSAIHVGKNPANNSSRVYVRRDDWPALATTVNEVFAPWRGLVNDFRDRHLLANLPELAEIQVQSATGFTLHRQGSNAWSVVGEKFPTDAARVRDFVTLLRSLRVAEFVKDFNTAQDLQNFGLTTPERQIVLRSEARDATNPAVQLLFSAVRTNEVYVKRADEDYVYALPATEVTRLPENGWEFRERRLWSFSETNVAQLTLKQNGKTRQVVRTGKDKWSLAVGSQGLVDPVGLEQTAAQLGDLVVLGWFGRNPADLQKFGLNPNNLQITVELKSGEKHTLDFGLELSQTALAAFTLDGERWVGILPPAIYQLAVTYLTIPASTP
jgi:hypothetical protein